MTYPLWLLKHLDLRKSRENGFQLQQALQLVLGHCRAQNGLSKLRYGLRQRFPELQSISLLSGGVGRQVASTASDTAQESCIRAHSPALTILGRRARARQSARAENTKSPKG